MSLAGETQSSRGPKGAAPGEPYEADAPMLAWRRGCKEAEAVSAPGETQSSRGPKGAAPGEPYEADAQHLVRPGGTRRPRR